MTNRNVLIVVDAQFDFCEGGALASTGAAQTCTNIADYLESNARNYSSIIFSKDWHITPGDHFKTWPVHCVAGTRGADFFWTIQSWIDAVSLMDSGKSYQDGSQAFSKGIHTVYKGQRNDGYSAWRAFSDGYSSVRDILNRHTPAKGSGILTIDVCGLVTEHCVKATVLDALKEKFSTEVNVRLLEDLTTAHSKRDAVEALAEMESAGAIIGSAF